MACRPHLSCLLPNCDIVARDDTALSTLLAAASCYQNKWNFNNVFGDADLGFAATFFRHQPPSTPGANCYCHHPQRLPVLAAHNINRVHVPRVITSIRRACDRLLLYFAMPSIVHTVTHVTSSNSFETLGNSIPGVTQLAMLSIDHSNGRTLS